MAAKIQLRRDTAANWAANNPILWEWEMGLVMDTMKVKVGNGTTAFNSLPFYITQNSWTTIISASFNGDDIEFTLDNLGVVKIIGGKTDITWPRGIQGIQWFKWETWDVTTSVWAIVAQQIATPTNPTSWYNKLYFKADWKAYTLNSAWVEVQVWTGGSFLATQIFF